MMKSIRISHYLRRIAGMALLCVLLCVTAVGTADTEDRPVLASVEVHPQAILEPGKVRVTIKLVNRGANDTAMRLTLFDPDGNVCVGFGENGTATLVPGIGASYQTNWEVTQEQYDTEDLFFTGFYLKTGADGIKTPTLIQIDVPVQSIDASTVKPMLSVERVIRPSTTLAVGEAATILYRLENVGMVDLLNIVINDPEIGAMNMRDRLNVGEFAELSYGFTARQDMDTVISHATISYEYEVAGQRISVGALMVDPPVAFSVRNAVGSPDP